MEKTMDNEMEAGSIMGKIRVVLGLNNYNYVYIYIYIRIKT